MIASLFRQAAALAANAMANELRKPENQEKLATAARTAAAKLRDPATSEQLQTLANNGARALGRAIGNLKNR
jgi:hypothetical protein